MPVTHTACSGAQLWSHCCSCRCTCAHQSGACARFGLYLFTSVRYSHSFIPRTVPRSHSVPCRMKYSWLSGEIQAGCNTARSPSGPPHPAHSPGLHVSLQGHESLPQRHRSRTGLQPHIALPCLAMGFAEPRPPTQPYPSLALLHPCPQGVAQCPGLHCSLARVVEQALICPLGTPHGPQESRAAQHQVKPHLQFVREMQTWSWTELGLGITTKIKKWYLVYLKGTL